MTEGLAEEETEGDDVDEAPSETVVDSDAACVAAGDDVGSCDE